MSDRITEIQYAIDLVQQEISLAHDEPRFKRTRPAWMTTLRVLQAALREAKKEHVNAA